MDGETGPFDRLYERGFVHRAQGAGKDGARSYFAVSRKDAIYQRTGHCVGDAIPVLGDHPVDHAVRIVMVLTIVAYDGAGNVSAALAVTVAINDLADDPVAPQELFVTGSYDSGGNYTAPASRGLWADPFPQYCWQDVDMTIPAEEGSSVARWFDQSPASHRIIQPDPLYRPTLVNRGGVWMLYFNQSFMYVDGPGAFNFAELTAIITMSREDTASGALLSVPNSLNPAASNNQVWLMSVLGGASFRGVAASSSYTSSGEGAPPDSPRTLSLRPSLGQAMSVSPSSTVTVTGTLRPVLTYPVQGLLRIGATPGQSQLFTGYVHGVVITDRNESDGMSYRIKRQQFGNTGGNL